MDLQQPYRKLQRTDEDVTDFADIDLDRLTTTNNPLDKSDNVHVDVDKKERRRNICCLKRNILESTVSTENNLSVLDSFRASVTGEDGEDGSRTSGFLEVNNKPYQAKDRHVAPSDNDANDLGPNTEDDIPTSVPHLPDCKSKDEKYDTFCTIKDNFKSLKEVCQAMKDAGVKECNLILGIDYTLSNRIQGKTTFGGRCLHDLSKDVVNPYKETICIFGETLEDLKQADADIPVFGIGKELSLITSQTKCTDFGSVLDLYEEYTPTVRLGGPTNFAPIIYESIKIVERTNKFHILLIIADGQVTKEEETIEAIIEASAYALSIVVVGVGDGPWEVMHDFDDRLPGRKFDNFQFVEFHSIKDNAKNPETELALMAVMEIPQQYKCITAMQLLDCDDELNEDEQC